MSDQDKAEVRSAYWRQLAEVTRARADSCYFHETKEILYRISADYEKLALLTATPEDKTGFDKK